MTGTLLQLRMAARGGQAGDVEAFLDRRRDAKQRGRFVGLRVQHFGARPGAIEVADHHRIDPGIEPFGAADEVVQQFQRADLSIADECGECGGRKEGRVHRGCPLAVSEQPRIGGGARQPGACRVRPPTRFRHELVVTIREAGLRVSVACPDYGMPGWCSSREFVDEVAYGRCGGLCCWNWECCCATATTADLCADPAAAWGSRAAAAWRTRGLGAGPLALGRPALHLDRRPLCRTPAALRTLRRGPLDLGAPRGPLDLASGALGIAPDAVR